MFSHRFLTASPLAVHLSPDTVSTTLYHRPSQWWLWFDPGAHVGWDALFVDDDRFLRGSERYRPLFREVDPEPVVVEVRRAGRPAHVFEVYRYYDFAGAFETRE